MPKSANENMASMGDEERADDHLGRMLKAQMKEIKEQMDEMRRKFDDTQKKYEEIQRRREVRGGHRALVFGTSPVDCNASHGSTASLVEAMTGRRGKRGPSGSLEVMTTVAEVHRDPDERNLRTLTGGAPRDTPKRRKYSRRINDNNLDEIKTANDNKRPPNQEGTTEPPNNDEEKIPPIVLRDGAKWLKVNAELKRNINFTKAKSTREGVRFFPATSTDFRAATKMLGNDGYPYHTYQLPSEKPLNVVIREMPIGISNEDIGDALAEKGIIPESVTRMSRRRGGDPIPRYWSKSKKNTKTFTS